MLQRRERPEPAPQIVQQSPGHSSHLPALSNEVLGTRCLLRQFCKEATGISEPLWGRVGWRGCTQARKMMDLTWMWNKILKPRRRRSEASPGITLSESGGQKSHGRSPGEMGPGQGHVLNRPESSSMVAENARAVFRGGSIVLIRDFPSS